MQRSFGRAVLVSALCCMQCQMHALEQVGDGGFQEVMAWLKSNGATANPALRSSIFQLGGASVRGVLSTSELPQQTTLLVIPKRLWLVPSHFPKFAQSQLPSTCAPLIKDCELKFAAALADESRKGNSSFYYTYLKHLPTTKDFRSFLPRMMEAGLQSDFAALPLVSSVQKAQADDNDVQTCFERWVKKDDCPARGLTWDQVQLALNWLHTRSFTMYQYFGTQDHNALIPGADMLNTAKAVDLNVEWSSTEEVYTMQTGTPAASGHELSDAYCEDCDNDYLMKHLGVFMEDNANPLEEHDAQACIGDEGIHMSQLVKAALQDPAAYPGLLSPRCRASTLNEDQGPLRCSLARLAWESCAKDWEGASKKDAALVEISAVSHHASHVAQERFLSIARK